METKTCYKCKATKAIDAFSKGQKMCKDCYKVYKTEYNARKAAEKPTVPGPAPVVATAEKRCSKCEVTKPIDAFSTGRNQCKECRAAYMKQRYHPIETPKVKKTEKFCKTCDVKKPVEDFYQDCGSCKVCYSKQIAEARMLRIAHLKEMGPEEKECIRCHETKSSTLFELGRNECKECRKQHRVRAVKRCTACKREKSVACFYRVFDSQKGKYVHKSQCKVCYKKVTKELTYKTQRNDRLMQRHQQDPVLRIVRSMRVRVATVLRGKKNTHFYEYLECTKQQFSSWIDFQKSEDMTNEEYGKSWHLDHVIPIAFFNLDVPEERTACFHWTNLQPLYAKKNMQKSTKIVPEMIRKHQTIVKNYIATLEPGYQASLERCWWLRAELRYGNNPKDETVQQFKERLKSVIRSQAPLAGEGSTT